LPLTAAARTGNAFTLREVDVLSSEEICALLGIRVNNLWAMLHRARLHLRHCLELGWFKRDTDQGAAVGL
jgi:RNA polymerase sigma-70 factor (ECF subfamily)